MRYRQIASTATLIVPLIALAPTAIRAQEPNAPVVEKLHEKVKVFFESVKEGSIATAYDQLLNSGPLAAREDRQSLEEDTAEIKELYGAYLGFERVYTKRVGEDLVFVKYLYKCSRFPVLWHLTFYRTPSNSEIGTESARSWQVVSIRFDTDLELLTLLKSELPED